MNLSFKIIDTESAEYSALLSLRNEILRAPLGLNLYEEDLSGDKDDIIITAMDDEHMIGCVMLTPINEEVIKLRQMAVATAYQGKGIGGMIVREAEHISAEHGYKKIMMHARETAIPFYESLQYTSYGEPFSEVTIPHIAMQKTLA